MIGRSSKTTSKPLREILLIGAKYFLFHFAASRMRWVCALQEMKQWTDKITMNLSIDRLWWWCGFCFFFSASVCIAYGHVAHIVCARTALDLVKHERKEQFLRTKWRTASDNSIGIFFLFILCFHLSISHPCSVPHQRCSASPRGDHPVVIIQWKKIKFQ